MALLPQAALLSTLRLQASQPQAFASLTLEFMCFESNKPVTNLLALFLENLSQSTMQVVISPLLGPPALFPAGLHNTYQSDCTGTPGAHLLASAGLPKITPPNFQRQRNGDRAACSCCT